MRRRLVVSLLSLTPLWALAATLPLLVKVTSANNARCVEYVNYKGEMYCSTQALGKTPVDPQVKDYETQQIAFDERPWQAAWGKNTPMIVTVEYVVLGDNIDAWHELITSQFMPGIQNKVTPKQFAEFSLERLKQAGFNPLVTFHKDTQDQVLYEFRIESPASQTQDELQLITRGKNGLYSLHYVIKKADMGEENRKKWLALLLSSRLKVNG